MLSKIDKHHVDCDILQLTPETWTQSPAESSSASYHTVLMKDSSSIVVLPGTPTSSYTLNVDGVARDLGGNKCGLPITGHPFSAGDTVRISGTTYYDLSAPIYHNK